jgi:tyrosyl-tRNA synthetase
MFTVNNYTIKIQDAQTPLLRYTMVIMTHGDRLEKARQALIRRAQHVLPSVDEVARRLASEDPKTFYLGIDPTGPDIHIGHTVPMLFLEQLAQLGHRIVVLVGDFTARIGDPTGKDTTRKTLTPDDVSENMKRYEAQARATLPTIDFRIVYNSTWLNTMTLGEILGLTSRMTVQQMITRDMFQERLKHEKPIAISEFLYPLLQGYDSVALRTDGEVGGNDQLFNMMVGRDLCKEIIGTDKMVVATHLVIDPVSGKKMSKTEGIPHRPHDHRSHRRGSRCRPSRQGKGDDTGTDGWSIEGKRECAISRRDTEETR